VVHDYHLMLVPRMLRERRPDVRVGFFLHTPFPELAAWRALRKATPCSAASSAPTRSASTCRVRRALRRGGRGDARRRGVAGVGRGVLDDDGRPVSVHAAPMGIDVGAFSARAADARCASSPTSCAPTRAAVRRRRPAGPDQGIPERLDAFARCSNRRPDLRGRARLPAAGRAVARGRAGVPRPARRVEDRVARVNARFGAPGYEPVHYVYGSVDAAGWRRCTWRPT
jgi:trehalose-6-phosphate synthase